MIIAWGRNIELSVKSRVELSGPEVNAAKNARAMPSISAWSVAVLGLAGRSSITVHGSAVAPSALRSGTAHPSAHGATIRSV